MAERPSDAAAPDGSVVDANTVEDWQVRVHIIEARNLKGKDATGMSDPVCSVEVFGKIQSTKQYKETVSALFDRWFLFEASQGQIAGQKLDIKVFDANMVLRNVLIGRHTLDLEWIHSQKNHEIFAKWLLLSKPNGKNPGSQGFLKVSVMVLGPGETAAAHDEGAEFLDDNDGADLQSMVLMPPEISATPSVLRVGVFEASALPIMDTGIKPSADPYVKVHFNGQKAKTRVIKNSLSPTWDEQLEIPFTMPTFEDNILITVSDRDGTSKNDTIVKFKVSMADVLAGKLKEPRWYYLTADLKNLKAQSSADGAIVRGKLLMSFDVESREGTLQVTKAIRPRMPSTTNFLLDLDLYEMDACPVDNKVIAKLQVGTMADRIEVATAEVTNGRAQFLKRLDTVTVNDVPEDPTQRPDVFIFFYEKSRLGTKTRFGYVHIPASQLKLDATPQWYEVLADPFASSEISEGKRPGVVLMRLSFASASEVSKSERHVRPPLEAPKMKKHLLVANVYQARGLRSRDTDGSNDAFVRAEIVSASGLARSRTKTRHNTNFPVWYETLKVEVEVPEQKSLLPLLTLNMYDEDSKIVGKASKEFVGSAQIDISGDAELRWVKLTTLSKRGALGSLLAALSKAHRHAQRKIDSGELLVSAKLIPADDVTKISALPKSISPKFLECVIDIDVVSLFDLAAVNARPVTRPVVEFSIPDGASEKLATVSSTRVHVHKISLENGASGGRANSASILQRLRVEVQLPKKVAFSPNMNVRLIDDCHPTSRVIGTGSIYLGQFFPWAKPDELAAGDAKRFIDEDDLEVTVVQQAKLQIEPETPEEKPKFAHPDEAQVPLDNVPLTPSTSSSRPPARQKDKMKESVVVDMPHDEAAREKQPLLAPPAAQAQQEQEPQRHVDPEELRSMVRKHLSTRSLNIAGQEQQVGPADAPPEEPERPRIKHPRMDQELERTIRPPFLTCRLARRRGVFARLFGGEHEDGSAADPSHHVQNIVEAGKLRGAVRIYPKSGEVPKLQSLEEIMKPQEVVVRVYLLKGRNFVPKDPDGLCDSYIKIKNRTKSINIDDSSNVIQNSLDPEWNKCFQFNSTVPSSESEIIISVYDHDAHGKDDLVGETAIDLETRWFSDEWKAMDPKPIERRQLRHPSSKHPQGFLDMFIDIMTPEEARRKPQEDLRPPRSKQQWELRVVVWNTKDVKPRDNYTKESDIFVSGKPSADGCDVQVTDVHWRSDNGEGMFNWRFVWPNIVLPSKNPRFVIQVWDKDYIGVNDAIAEATLNFRSLFAKAFALEEPKRIRLDRQWVQLYHPNYSDGLQGRVELTVELVPAAEAALAPAGLGRDEPNRDPFLDEPKRPEKSFNPLRADKWVQYGAHTFWAAHKWKFIIFVVLVILAAIGVPILLHFLGRL
eukprot:TRINITY_DN5939_c0_g1_i1.p1 TRINITY_DN5939_c0_g1~~TRINITY_DN5939_c0_g1_i1.p1  ORF type:complete len:1400 (-),score=332.16 TRINITY_DN5939_c0_g1_i1:124-4323(-)